VLYRQTQPWFFEMEMLENQHGSKTITSPLKILYIETRYIKKMYQNYEFLNYYFALKFPVEFIFLIDDCTKLLQPHQILLER
jgi:hypothetical protein